MTTVFIVLAAYLLFCAGVLVGGLNRAAHDREVYRRGYQDAVMAGLNGATAAGDVWLAGFQAGLDAQRAGGGEEAENNRRFYEGLPLEDRR